MDRSAPSFSTKRGRYLAANRLACKLSGYTRKELLEGGAKALSFDPRAPEDDDASDGVGDLQAGAADLKRKDGTAISCEYRLGATRSGGMPFFIVVFWEQGETD